MDRKTGKLHLHRTQESIQEEINEIFTPLLITSDLARNENSEEKENGKKKSPVYPRY
jgi:hypothetical protein